MATIAILGGTGKEGRALALRFTLAGHDVCIGSRSRERAESVAQDVRRRLGPAAIPVRADTNDGAAAAADLLCVCLPAAALADTLGGLRGHARGKIVVELVNPIGRGPAGLDLLALPAPSAGEWVAALLPDAMVVSAFKTVSAGRLADLERPVDGDVLVCGDAPDAKQRIMDLARQIPNLRPIDCGPLHHARYVEALTVLLLEINRTHRATASIRIVGLETGK